MIKMRRTLSQIGHIFTGLLFTWNSETLFLSLAKKDPKREEELHFKATRIVHYAAITIILIILILVTVLPRAEADSAATATDNVGIFILYLVSVLMVGSGFLIPKILGWRLISRSTIGIFKNHGFQTTMFILPVVISLLIWRGGTSLLVVLPAICISVIALALTFPTRRRWGKWTDYTSFLD
jgi:hypothetical protein